MRSSPIAAAAFEPFLHVALLEHLARPVGVVRPDARVAVGLELEHHRERVAPALSRDPLLRLVHLLRGPEQRLHVMSHLVGDHVGLREVAGRAEALAQVTVEGEVDVDLLVARAVEGTHRRLRHAAGRAHHAARRARASAARS